MTKRAKKAAVETRMKDAEGAFIWTDKERQEIRRLEERAIARYRLRRPPDVGLGVTEGLSEELGTAKLKLLAGRTGEEVEQIYFALVLATLELATDFTVVVRSAEAGRRLMAAMEKFEQRRPDYDEKAMKSIVASVIAQGVKDGIKPDDDKKKQTQEQRSLNFKLARRETRRLLADQPAMLRRVESIWKCRVKAAAFLRGLRADPVMPAPAVEAEREEPDDLN